MSIDRNERPLEDLITHQTECFGPVLGVVRCSDLDDAIDVQNGTPFGLTGGIQSLDDREVEVSAFDPAYGKGTIRVEVDDPEQLLFAAPLLMAQGPGEGLSRLAV